MAQIVEIPLPESWPKHVKASILHTVSLVFTATCGWAAKRTDKLIRLRAELEKARSEFALLREEISIKDVRFKRVPSPRRPYYRPFERMRIVKIKAARGWSTRQTAAAFLLNEQTISSWLRRVDEEGECSLIRIPESEHVSGFRAVYRGPVENLLPDDGIFAHRPDISPRWSSSQGDDRSPNSEERKTAGGRFSSAVEE
jgi:hypothetical protein